MIDRIWDVLVRWRTWIVNVVFGAILTPEVILVLMGFDWGTIVPVKYMPAVTITLALLNVWMRPRPAVRAHDPEAKN